MWVVEMALAGWRDPRAHVDPVCGMLDYISMCKPWGDRREFTYFPFTPGVSCLSCGVHFLNRRKGYVYSRHHDTSASALLTRRYCR